MTIPLYFQPVKYLKSLRLIAPITLRELCNQAGVKCQASGPWTERQIEIVSAETTMITSEPGEWGRVRLEIRAITAHVRAQIALAAMAYGVNDLVARQSIRGSLWAQLKAPKGRPKSTRTLTNKERQRRFRERKKKTR